MYIARKLFADTIMHMPSAEKSISRGYS